MRITVNLNKALLSQAQALCGKQDRSALLREALNALIQRESARQLARMGGSQPQLADIPRRQEN